MLAFKMCTVCYARLITKTEAYLIGTALIKLLLVSDLSAAYVMACKTENTPHPWCSQGNAPRQRALQGKETPTSHHHVNYCSLAATHQRNYCAAVDRFKFTLFMKS